MDFFRGPLKQSFLRWRRAGDAKMAVRVRGCAPSARSARNEPLFKEVRLDDVFERFGVFSQRCRDCGNTGRPAAVLFDDRAQKRAIQAIEAEFVDAFALQRLASDCVGYASVRAYLGEIADTAKQPVSHARRTADSNPNAARFRSAHARER